MTSHAEGYPEHNYSDWGPMEGISSIAEDRSWTNGRSPENHLHQARHVSQKDLNLETEHDDLVNVSVGRELQDVDEIHADAPPNHSGISTNQGPIQRPESASNSSQWAFGPAPDRRQLNPGRASHATQHPGEPKATQMEISAVDTNQMNSIHGHEEADRVSQDLIEFKTHPNDTPREYGRNEKPSGTDAKRHNDGPALLVGTESTVLKPANSELPHPSQTLNIQEEYVDGTSNVPQGSQGLAQGTNNLVPFRGTRLVLNTMSENRIPHNVDKAQSAQRWSGSRQPTPSGLDVHPAVRQHRSVSPQEREQPQNPGKIRKAKSQRKIKTTGMVSLTETPADLLSTEQGQSQEDLLRMLMMSVRQEAQAREDAKVVQRKKDKELKDAKQACSQLKYELQALQDQSQDLRDESQVLQEELQGLRNQEKGQAAQLSKYQKVVPGWKANLRKLQDYFKGLTNDHNKLRSDATMIRKELESLRADKAIIETSLKEAQAAAAQAVLAWKPSDCKATLAEARHRIELMEQAVHSQRTQLIDKAKLLDDERNQNQLLVDKVSKISTDQQEMLRMVLSYREVVQGKLDQLLNSSLAMSTMAKGMDEESIKSMLDRCVASLRELQSPQTVKMEDLQRLNESIRVYADRVMLALQESNQTSKSSQQERSRFEHDIETQMNALSAGIKTEEALSQQIVDLREMKATIRERLQASDTALVVARQILAGFQGREQLHLQTISDLKADLMLLRSNPAQDTTALLRIRELESSNTTLEASLAMARSDLVQHNEEMECRDDAATLMKEQLDSIKVELEEAKVVIAGLEEEKVEYKALAKSEKENLSAQYLKATKAEKAILRKEYLNELTQLRRQKDAAEEKALQSESQLEKLGAEKSNQNEGASQLRAQIACLEIQGAEQARSVAQVQEKLRRAVEEAASKDTEIQTIRKDGLKTTDELRVQITDLKAQGTEYENAIAQLQKDLLAAIEDGHSKDADYQIKEEENKNLRRQRDQVEQEFNSKTFEMQSYHDNLLARINTMCQDYDAQSIPQTEVNAALSILSTFLISAKEISQRPLVESMSLGQDALQGSYGDRDDLSLDEVELIDSQDRELQASMGTQQRRKANRHNSIRTNASSEMLFQDTQVEEETTIHRSVRKTTSSHGLDTAGLTTPNDRGQQPNSQTPQISKYLDIHHDSLDSESPLGDMSGYFPPTPIPKSDLDSSTGRRNWVGSSQMQPNAFSDTRQPATRPTTYEQTRATTRTSASQPTGTNSPISRSRDRFPATPGVRSDPLRVPGRSILKETKSLKRDSTMAGLGAPKEQGRKRAVSGLGPVIEDSQPSNQDPSLPKAKAHGRKSQRKQTKDKYELRFHNED